MAQKALILCFLLFSFLFCLKCGENPPVDIPHFAPPITTGTITGVLMGDGILVPNNTYGYKTVHLYKDNQLLKTDTTNREGEFYFYNIVEGNYQLKTEVNFSHDNFAYGSTEVNLQGTFVDQNLLLDSIKYDCFPIRIGATYKYSVYYGYENSELGTGYNTESEITITIMDSQKVDNSIYYLFQGERIVIDPPYEGFSVEPVIDIAGRFENTNGLVTCNFTSGGGFLSEEVFRGIHIYDGSSLVNEFLNLYGLSSWPIYVYFGFPFQVNNQQFETLYIYGKCCEGAGHGYVKYNYSYELLPVFVEENDYYESATHYIGWHTIYTLLDFNF